MLGPCQGEAEESAVWLQVLILQLVTSSNLLDLSEPVSSSGKADERKPTFCVVNTPMLRARTLRSSVDFHLGPSFWWGPYWVPRSDQVRPPRAPSLGTQQNGAEFPEVDGCAGPSSSTTHPPSQDCQGGLCSKEMPGFGSSSRPPPGTRSPPAAACASHPRPGVCPFAVSRPPLPAAPTPGGTPGGGTALPSPVLQDCTLVGRELQGSERAGRSISLYR